MAPEIPEPHPGRPHRPTVSSLRSRLCSRLGWEEPRSVPPGEMTLAAPIIADFIQLVWLKQISTTPTFRPPWASKRHRVDESSRARREGRETPLFDHRHAGTRYDACSKLHVMTQGLTKIYKSFTWSGGIGTGK